MENLTFKGPARCFDCEEDAFTAVENKKYNDGDVIVIRYEGPKEDLNERDIIYNCSSLWTG